MKTQSKIDTTAAQRVIAALKGTSPSWADIFEAARFAMPKGDTMAEQQAYDRAARKLTDAWDKERRGGSLNGPLPTGTW